MRSGLVLAVLWLAPLVAFASECTVPDWISSQDQLNNATKGCTTVIGNLNVEANYTGTFVLQDVTNLTGFIEARDDYNNGYLSAIEMPNLETAGGMYLVGNATTLSIISFPKLRTVYGSLVISSSNLLGNLSFPALEKVESITIQSMADSVDFPSLRNVTNMMTINTNSGNNATAVPISFPKLQIAGSIRIFGNMLSINLPLLETVSSSNYAYVLEPGLHISNYGLPINVTVPLLSNASGINLEGIPKLSFPSLIHLDGDFTVNAKIASSISFLPLQTAGGIFLTGSVLGFDLSSMKNFNALTIFSTQPTLNCDLAHLVWNSTSHNQTISGTNASKIKQEYSCFATPDYSAYDTSYHTPSMAVGTQVAIGVGISISLIALACVWNCWRESKKSGKANASLPVVYEHELDLAVRRSSGDNRGSNDELPGYQPRGVPGQTVGDAGPVLISEVEPPEYEMTSHDGAATPSEVGTAAETMPMIRSSSRGAGAEHSP